MDTYGKGEKMTSNQLGTLGGSYLVYWITEDDTEIMMGIETLKTSRTLKEEKIWILGGGFKVHGLSRTHTP